jgi:hypothetical protein
MYISYTNVRGIPRNNNASPNASPASVLSFVAMKLFGPENTAPNSVK